MAKFHYDEEGEEVDHGNRNRQLQSDPELTSFLQNTVSSQQHQDSDNNIRRTQAATACTSFHTIEVAIAYESRFCEFYGGEQAANQVVALTVAEASLKFERPGICTKLVVSHLEGYCDASRDPYRDIFQSGRSVCKQDDNNNIMKLFKEYWEDNRAQVQRDVAHLFHGYNHASGTVGCAYGSSLCDNLWGYGVNEITYGGNRNPTFWGSLFAHEMGHSAGALHECCDGYLMDTIMCADCHDFSPTSVSYMSQYLNQPRVSQCLTTRSSSSNTPNLAPPLLASPTQVTTAPTKKPVVVTTTTSTTANTPPRGGSGGVGQCRRHMEYCNDDVNSCCSGITCHNNFICLDL